MRPEAPAVLVVDDEAANLKMLRVALHLQGFRVMIAANGEDAVELYRQHHEAIMLVLSDVNMDGLDGPQTLAALREINPAVRCCFMSGNPGRYSEAELKEWGAAFIDKPFGLGELSDLLRNVLAYHKQ